MQTTQGAITGIDAKTAANTKKVQIFNALNFNQDFR